jgi:hypothetical protein
LAEVESKFSNAGRPGACLVTRKKREKKMESKNRKRRNWETKNKKAETKMKMKS